MGEQERRRDEGERGGRGEARELERLYGAHRAALWGVCYRMTGSCADADDLVQATFERALVRPPADRGRPWRPWLMRVAVNLSRDHLRRRRRRGYDGPWLPAPVEVAPEAPGLAGELEAFGGVEGRYGLLESVTVAFLMALEALTPQQRGVLLLRDVFDYSGREVAEALGLSEGNVKVTLHRARRAMASYDAHREVPDAVAGARALEALTRFMGCLALEDVAGIEALLAEEVRVLTDAGGEVRAARRVVRGVGRVAALFLGLRRKFPVIPEVRLAMLNGAPALVMDFPDMGPRHARRQALSVALGPDGRICEVRAVLASRKLSALGPVA